LSVYEVVEDRRVTPSVYAHTSLFVGLYLASQVPIGIKKTGETVISASEHALQAGKTTVEKTVEVSAAAVGVGSRTITTGLEALTADTARESPIAEVSSPKLDIMPTRLADDIQGQSYLDLAAC
jgi:hypothetical protein